MLVAVAGAAENAALNVRGSDDPSWPVAARASHVSWGSSQEEVPPDLDAVVPVAQSWRVSVSLLI